MEYSILRDGLHDLRNQLLELTLAWDLIALEKKIEDNRFPFLLNKAKNIAEFIQTASKLNSILEPVDLGNLLQAVLNRLRENGMVFPCLIADSFPVIMTNEYMLSSALQSLFPMALQKFCRGVLVRMEIQGDNIVLFIEPGNEPLSSGYCYVYDLGASTVEAIIAFLNGKVEWSISGNTKNIRITLPLAAKVSLQLED